MDLVVALAVALGATEGEEDKKAIISVIGDASADAFDFKAESASSSMWGPAFPPCLSLSLILSLSPPTAPRPFEAFSGQRRRCSPRKSRLRRLPFTAPPRDPRPRRKFLARVRVA